MTLKKWVAYHSPEWDRMVEEGWVTMQVHERMALMIKRVKL